MTMVKHVTRPLQETDCQSVLRPLKRGLQTWERSAPKGDYSLGDWPRKAPLFVRQMMPSDMVPFEGS